MLDSSTFNQNRISVIRKTIQSTLNTAIANYSSSAAYEFRMPIFTEEDWDKIVNNIAVATFMQGMPIGAKYFNNYCIVTNNKNKEVVTKDSIYIITSNGEAHMPGCKKIIENTYEVTGAYRNIDFEMQTVVGNDNYNYFRHGNDRCYYCMVNASGLESVDDIISGETSSGKKINEDLRKTYLIALARERQNLYKTNNYFGN